MIKIPNTGPITQYNMFMKDSYGNYIINENELIQTATDTGLMTPPFSWSFHNGKTLPDKFRLNVSTFTECLGFLGVGKTPKNQPASYLFFCKDAVQKKYSCNACHPAHLHAEYNRKYGTIFENMNKNTHAEIPKLEVNDYYCYGFGISNGTDSENITELTFKYKEKTYTISKTRSQPF
jgi:hypothetical protein